MKDINQIINKKKYKKKKKSIIAHGKRPFVL